MSTFRLEFECKARTSALVVTTFCSQLKTASFFSLEKLARLLCPGCKKERERNCIVYSREENCFLVKRYMRNALLLLSFFKRIFKMTFSPFNLHLLHRTQCVRGSEWRYQWVGPMCVYVPTIMVEAFVFFVRVTVYCGVTGSPFVCGNWDFPRATEQVHVLFSANVCVCELFVRIILLGGGGW